LRAVAGLVALFLLLLAFLPGAVPAVQADITGLDSLVLTGNLTVGGNALISGTTTYGGPVIQSSAAISVTNGQTVTPSYGLYQISSAGNVTITLASCSNTGQNLKLVGALNHTVLIAHSNVKTTSGSTLSLVQNAVADFTCIGTTWYQIAALAGDS
jgi:hypothetical protein